MATLSGKITDVTSKTPENISSITVKAPSARIGSGTDVIVSSPATVDFNRDTGDITVSGLTGGLSWLFIEGDGWSDSIALAVAEGMITLVEAIANAAGVPGLADFIGLLVDLQNRIDDIAQDAVDAAAEDIMWPRATLPYGADVNDYFGVDYRGAWSVDNSGDASIPSLENLPQFAQGILTVNSSTVGFTTQMFHSHGKDGALWVRSQTTLNAAEWTPWANISGPSSRYRGRPEEGADLNQFYGSEYAGNWSIHNDPTGNIMGTFANLPEFRQGTLSVEVSGAGFTTQVYRSFGTGAFWYRSQAALGQEAWTPWVNLADGTSGVSEHDIRVNRARHRARHKEVSGDAVAVAVVLDHGTNRFNEDLLPMFVERNIPVTIALNGDMYNPDDVRYEYNNRTTWADVKRWHDDHGVEIANHGMTHGNVLNDPDAQEWEVTESLKVLEDNLPGVPIDSWVNAAGITSISDPVDYLSHQGTRAIYRHHAVMTGSVLPQYWPLTGEPRVGMSRYWIDSPTGANSSTRNSLLNVPAGHGTMVSFHPELIGQDSRSSMADIEGFLDWLVSQRDAGKFVLMTMREVAFAEYKPPAATRPFPWTDMNDAVIEGDYDIARYADVRDLVNRPPASPIPAAARISVRRAGGTRLIQDWVGIISGGIGERWQRNRNSTGVWESWTLVHSDISRAEVLSLLDELKPAQTDHVVTVGDSQVGATYGWANLLADVSGQTVVNRGKSGNTPDEALLMTGGWRLPIEPVALIPGERVAVAFAGDYPVLGRDFSHNGYVLGKRVSLWYTHSTGGWEAILNAEEDPLTLSSPTLWASIYADFAPEKLSRRIVWFGGNSIRTGRHRPDESLVEHVQKAYSRAIDAWGETTLVCGYVPAYGDETGRDAANELNTWLSRTAPMQFLDMRHRIQLAAADILGRSLTSGEQLDIANGYLPRPLYRSDLVHLTDEAHVKIAEIVAEFPNGASPQISIRSNPAPIVSLTGTGSPEGNISAAVGSTYTDTAATNGAIRWIKASGAGATGWRVEYGDTGWRKIRSLITPEPASGSIDIRRHGSDVYVALEELSISGDGTYVQFATLLPAGFRPDKTLYLPLSPVVTADAETALRVQSNGTVTIYGTSGKSRATGTVRLLTGESWPTSLPGTPA